MELIVNFSVYFPFLILCKPKHWIFVCLESVAILVLGHGDLRPHVLSIMGE